MTKIYFSILFIAFFAFSFSQNTSSTKIEREDNIPFFNCGHNEKKDEMELNHPEKYQKYLESKEILRQQTEEGNLELMGDVPKSTIYKVPVVFHIVHEGGPENLSDEDIFEALEILNKNFRKQNENINEVYPIFQSLAADVEIEFHMATIAPNGLCFNGITRTFTTESEFWGTGTVQDAFLENDVYHGVWPKDKYMNIIIFKTLGDGVAGFTFTPSDDVVEYVPFLNSYYNCIFVRADQLVINTSTTLTHEVGHWLNLMHVWGYSNFPEEPSNCDMDDEVEDTPLTMGGVGCNLERSTCDGTIDNVENYMEYSYCRKMFTHGQKARMRTALTSPIAERNNLWTTANLQEVGVEEGGESICAEIQVSKDFACTQSSVQYSVDSDENIVSYQWHFPGGVPSTSTLATPTVMYPNVGDYDVQVTVTTSNFSVDLFETYFIHIEDVASGVDLPIIEGFVNSNFPPTGWNVEYSSTSGVMWERVTWAGNEPTAGSSAAIDNYTVNNQGDIADLILPTFSLENHTSATLTFDLAYKPYPNGFDDRLQVLISGGCGQEFEVVYDKEGTILQTEAADYTYYTNPHVWRKETIDLTSFIPSDKVRVKFRCLSNGGNYLYLDNINISEITDEPSGIEGNFLEQKLIIYPNPSTGTVNISSSFDIDEIIVTDFIGRVVFTMNGNKQQDFSFDWSHFASGNYYIQAKSGEYFKTERLVKE